VRAETALETVGVEDRAAEELDVVDPRGTARNGGRIREVMEVQRPR
jgi:hypothetical protein